LDKGVLTEHKVGGYGAAALWEEAETRVRFTYDRFFEYLLAGYLLSREVTVARVKELVEEADKHNFGSLWGAVKARLITYAETSPKAFTRGGLLAELAQEEGYAIRGLIVDVLVTHYLLQPTQVQNFLLEVLLKLNSPAAGLVALSSCYGLKATEATKVLEIAFSHPIPIVQQTATHAIYVFWNRHRKEGDELLNNLGKAASAELLRALPSLPPQLLVSRLRGQQIDFDQFPYFRGFLGVTFLLSAHLLTEPKAAVRFTSMWTEFYAGFPSLIRPVVIALAKRYAGNIIVEAYRKSQEGIINHDTLGIFTSRPLDDPLRLALKEYAPYMDTSYGSISAVADKVFELGQVVDGVISLIVVGILINHINNEPEPTLKLLQRMYYEGNAFSKYNVVRAMSSALQREGPLPPGHLEFFNEAILDLWTGEEIPIAVIKGRTYGLRGHLFFPMAFECRQKERGKLEFVDKLRARPWDGDPVCRDLAIIKELGLVGLSGLFIKQVSLYPVLETLSQWFGFEGRTEQQTEEVRQALVRTLSRLWMVYPDQVESFLADQPVLEMRVLATQVRELAYFESEGEVVYATGLGGIISFLYMPAALAGLVTTVQRICDEVTSVEVGLRMIAAYFMDPDTIIKARDSISDVK